MQKTLPALVLFSLTAYPVFAKNFGGVNLNAQCARQAPGSRPVLADKNNKITKETKAAERAYGWRCVAKNGTLQSIDLNAACAAQHGSTVKAEAADVNDAYSWKCVSANEVTPATASGSLLEYQNYKGQKEKLYAYSGARSVVLLPKAVSATDATRVTSMIDSCSAVYSDLSVRGWPSNSMPQAPGKPSVAVVQATCGAGCGAGGRAEIQIKEFAVAEERMGNLVNPLTWQVGFYELGRGGSSHKRPAFAVYPALDPSAGHDVVASAFPEFVMSVCIDRLGVTPAAYEQSHKTAGYPRGPGVTEFGRRFLASGLTFVQAYEKDRNGFYRGWALSSLLFDLYRKFGYERMKVFMANLANIAQQSGQVRTHAGVAKNLLEAAHLSGGDAMASYLKQTWRVQ